jgi:hypothetical protein
MTLGGFGLVFVAEQTEPGSAPLPTGGYLEQADGTAWMAFFCQSMLEIANQLALSDRDYVEMGLKFLEHFFWISSSMARFGNTGMWDEEDGFFYDVLRLPNGQAQRLKVRSMVGLLPLCATTVFDGIVLKKYPEIAKRMRKFLEVRPEISARIHDPAKTGVGGRRLAIRKAEKASYWICRVAITQSGQSRHREGESPSFFPPKISCTGG